MAEQASFEGPGWQEWALSFVCTLLVGYGAFVGREMADPQAAERYYSQLPGVQAFQIGGLAVSLGVLVSTLAWIVLRRSAWLMGVVRVLAVAGILLAWGEIVRASNSQPDPVFVLNQLPFRPVNNMGVVGAQAFASYLILRGPSGSGSPWAWLLAKAGLSVCVWMFQLVVWDQLRNGLR